MKRPSMLILIIVAAGVMAAGKVAAETANSLNLGMGGVVQTMPHCKADVYNLEFEHMIDTNFSIFGRASEVSYKFDDGNYLEKGRPKGIDIGARFYPEGGMKGFFIGGSVGHWTSDWTFTKDEGTLNEAHGRADSNSTRVNVDIGDRFPIGSSSVSVMPALNVGRFFSSTSCEYTAPASVVGTSCNQRSEVKYYFFLSLMAGIGF